MGDKCGYKLVLSSVMQAALTWRGSLITEKSAQTGDVGQQVWCGERAW